MHLTRRLSIASALALAMGATAAIAQSNTAVYNSIPKPVPGNVSSEGPEAYAFSEIGDGVHLSGLQPGATLGRVTVIMSSWGCVQGSWYAGTCVTPDNATFSQPITVNVYSVPGTSSSYTPGALLATITDTFTLPYRPSVNPSCPADSNGVITKWYDAKDKTCYHGITAPITVDFSKLNIPMPSQLIVTVAYNTTDYGPQPIGQSACNTTSAGCPYDSLNVSTDTTDGTYTFIGSPLDPNGIFFNHIHGSLALDEGGWAGYHPQMEIDVNQKPASAGKKSLKLSNK
jgi:hypothetical protein